MRGEATTRPCAPAADRHGRESTRVPPPATTIRRANNPSAYGCRRRRLAAIRVSAGPGNRPAVASHRPSHFYDEARAYPIWGAPVFPEGRQQPPTALL